MTCCMNKRSINPSRLIRRFHQPITSSRGIPKTRTIHINIQGISSLPMRLEDHTNTNFASNSNDKKDLRVCYCWPAH